MCTLRKQDTLNVGKDYVLPMEENRNDFGVVPEKNDTVIYDETQNIGGVTEDIDTPLESDEENEVEKENFFTEREEYDALMKGRFKSFYAEDTQRLINRRFRKYKIMEERYKLLEEDVAKKEAQIAENSERIAGFDALLRSEIEKAIKETEERVIGEIKTKKLRPAENGTVPQRSASAFDVSKLSRDERANLAKRAAGGEKIKF